jgi:hypothetical protein
LIEDTQARTGELEKQCGAQGSEFSDRCPPAVSPPRIR